MQVIVAIYVFNLLFYARKFTSLNESACSSVNTENKIHVFQCKSIMANKKEIED